MTGHYTAMMQQNGYWWEMNDDKVTKIDAKYALQSDCNYLLFYTAITL